MLQFDDCAYFCKKMGLGKNDHQLNQNSQCFTHGHLEIDCGVSKQNNIINIDHFCQVQTPIWPKFVVVFFAILFWILLIYKKRGCSSTVSALETESWPLSKLSRWHSPWGLVLHRWIFPASRIILWLNWLHNTNKLKLSCTRWKRRTFVEFKSLFGCFGDEILT